MPADAHSRISMTTARTFSGSLVMTARSMLTLIGTAWLLSLLQQCVVADEGSLTKNFTEPPSGSRILKIIHSWPDAPMEQDALIRVIANQGFGGVVCNVSFDDYLKSEAKWRTFQRAVTRAKEAGWALWLYDERGYPSGNAGGIVLRDHPEWEASGLLIGDAESSGAAVSFATPPGRLFLAAAFPTRKGQIDRAGKVDLAGHVHQGRLTWQPPPGRWHVLVVTHDRLYEGTHAVSNLAEKMPYINLLMAEPTKRFLEVTHQAYADRLGTDLGKLFVSTFTDEPASIT